ncbi:bifunctional 2-C-methyl-D-erythritol 4-phosphate cytidylyltransferase/2-C-methyl-D-erythritol 2,4-cyclodiphosphate synthase [Roseibium polysiphoniae]|uniref:Bifunctional enzyme IspD/IspF n=1 Tax=Roseibium polysiphoniae TaxID=2571221 RepID=A0A944CBE5_9HYPH|nr:bifunctional 2-C-methyl-D-erythritol 4-phosphate cytidylyltransferase/2-C-methyl-D-erythritol 2,4-cyclodiphosphate synthase [Roseibium polysiphoniae]MBS8259442.1 bifunctional 2-C-methyl-D-erythritol 4-phosphate cytidylyltransferase/2-C-methyl-D-erythritol 2,4-cyclodiphosphate synthase [Roseibium polysiphoniae]
MTKQVAAIIVAGGRGSRLASSDDDRPKQYRTLAGRPILTFTLEQFLDHPAISKVLVVRHADDLQLYDNAVADLKVPATDKLLTSVEGGATRQASVYAGLSALQNSECGAVLIHDAARPFVTHDAITAVIERLQQGAKAVLSAIPVVDTLKRANADTHSLSTVDRKGLWAAQTPQGFDFEAIWDAHQHALHGGQTDFTDDTGVAEWAGHQIELADGNADNFKITSPADLERARKIMEMTDQIEATRPLAGSHALADLGDVRMGTGYDVHAFDTGDGVILGGISIPHDRKLKGHSDADVVLHAITDAVLGAIGDGDIGTHFPPSDPKWKGAASDQFLHDAIRRVEDKGGRIAHIDATIICELPKIGPHRERMRQAIADICALPVSRVSVKATTSERLGFTGRKEGIASIAAVTVRLPFSGDDAQ